MKRTPWVSLSIPPKRPGVYLTRREGTGIEVWRAFDGRRWYCGTVARIDGSKLYNYSPDYAHELQSTQRLEHWFEKLLGFQWCGLAREPAK
jgi:hypothetical protein